MAPQMSYSTIAIFPRPLKLQWDWSTTALPQKQDLWSSVPFIRFFNVCIRATMPLSSTSTSTAWTLDIAEATIDHKSARTWDQCWHWQSTWTTSGSVGIYILGFKHPYVTPYCLSLHRLPERVLVLRRTRRITTIFHVLSPKDTWAFRFIKQGWC